MAEATEAAARAAQQRIDREEMMKSIKIGLLAGAFMGLIFGTAMAQDKTLAIVVKGLDNPFFEQVNLGCQKWNGENASSGYKCLYTGPASSADEAGQIQVV